MAAQTNRGETGTANGDNADILSAFASRDALIEEEGPSCVDTDTLAASPRKSRSGTDNGNNARNGRSLLRSMMECSTEDCSEVCNMLKTQIDRVKDTILEIQSRMNNMEDKFHTNMTTFCHQSSEINFKIKALCKLAGLYNNPLYDICQEDFDPSQIIGPTGSGTGSTGEDEEGSGDYDYSGSGVDFQPLFEGFDTDEDGFVSAEELFDYSNYGDYHGLDDEEKEYEIGLIKKGLEEEGCDEDGDELLNMEEFENYWAAGSCQSPLFRRRKAGQPQEGLAGPRRGHRRPLL